MLRHELSDHSSLRFGGSWRRLPDFRFEDEVGAVAVSGLSNSVFGVDLQWTFEPEGEVGRWTAGAEILFQDGDLFGALVDPNGIPASGDESIAVVDDSATGFYAFVDYGWDEHWSTGLQFSQVELAADPASDATELDLFATYRPNRAGRLRLGATAIGNDLDADASRVYLQFTAFLGSHARGHSHGDSWGRGSGH